MAYNFDYASFLNSAKGLNGADKQMKFQSTMSSTAHQREVEDLKAAGLNPVLSAGGSGASTPSGEHDELADAVPIAIGGSGRTARKAIDNSAKTVKETTKSLAKVADSVVKMVKDVVNKPTSAKTNAQGVPNIPRRSSQDGFSPDITLVQPRLMDKVATPSSKGISRSTFDKRYMSGQMTFDDIKTLYKMQNNRDWYNRPYASTNALQASLGRMIIGAAKDLPMHMSAGYRQQIRWMRRNAKELKALMTEKAIKDYSYWLSTVNK